MDILKLITEARTCRRYDQSRELPAGTLSWLVDCARLSPSGANMQGLRFATIVTPAKRDEVFRHLLWAAYLKDWPGPAEGERPTGYVVILAPSGEDGKIGNIDYINVGIAAQSMQLAAWSKGLGACMFGGYNAKAVMDMLPMPEKYSLALALALGYAKEERKIVPVGADGDIKYFRAAGGTHCVPKRDLKDLLVAEL
ncbi:MAG: nitroreductase family protein [Deltaproteobacteria bacterium]|jgi:nitroreductase|nr:nitroreductase family protein [Deltaproteobacteria bacterium]